jgi:DNA-binding transcriptional regulator YiaG
MTPLAKLATLLQKALPRVQVTFAEPAAPNGVGFLDAEYSGNVLAVQWQKKSHFGVSSPEGHGYGEKPDEVYRTAEETAARMIELLRSGSRTEPPLEVTLRELRAARKLPQVRLADLLGTSQPAVSRLERNVSRMMVATLRAVIQAMGGDLVIQAQFPDGVVRQIALDDQTEASEDDHLATARR